MWSRCIFLNGINICRSKRWNYYKKVRISYWYCFANSCWKFLIIFSFTYLDVNKDKRERTSNKL